MKLLFVITIGLLVGCGICFAADAVTPTVTAPIAAPSLLDWFRANTAAILGVLLSVSELLSLIPAFRGNGILDTILKALHALSDKQTPAA